MNTYIQKLSQYLAQNQLANTPESILQFLEDTYLQEYPLTGEQVKRLETGLSDVFESMPLDQSNALFQTLYTLCEEYGRAGFRTGLHTGLRLQQEITQLP